MTTIAILYKFYSPDQFDSPSFIPSPFRVASKISLDEQRSVVHSMPLLTYFFVRKTDATEFELVCFLFVQPLPGKGALLSPKLNVYDLNDFDKNVAPFIQASTISFRYVSLFMRPR